MNTKSLTQQRQHMQPCFEFWHMQHVTTDCQVAWNKQARTEQVSVQPEKH